jgi:hypothetical protein
MSPPIGAGTPPTLSRKRATEVASRAAEKGFNT